MSRDGRPLVEPTSGESEWGNGPHYVERAGRKKRI